MLVDRLKPLSPILLKSFPGGGHLDAVSSQSSFQVSFFGYLETKISEIYHC